MVIFNDHVLASIRYNNRLFELRPIDLKDSTTDYVLFDVNDSRGESKFSCAANDIVQEKNSNKNGINGLHKDSQEKSLVLECVEIGIDIDNYTYNTFGNCDAAINWSLALLAGVDEIYRTELNDLITLKATYINIWQTPEPYAGITNNAGVMLDELRAIWINDPVLSASNHDLIHLMTKRTDTGTGGIAWLDVVCNSFGVGFSAYLDNTSNYTLPNYSWNLNVVGHELGHNFGANHTQWCGWPGGPIDNCADLEGTCTGYTNNPTAQVGTMMSYCHAIAGGSVILQFHSLVKTNALIPTINANGSCHGGCAGTVASCGSVYGCTDPTACNYDLSAQTDDGSCSVIDVCGVCAGGGASCTGCTDSVACNYMPSATIDDGSCVFPPLGFDCNCSSTINNIASLSAAQSATTTADAIGALTTLDLTLAFTNTTGGSSWAGDLLIEITAPNGQCLSIGGYDVSSSCTAGTSIWPTAWNVTASGTYTASYDFSNSGLSGSGLWGLTLTNGWSTSASMDYNMTATLGGVCTGPPAIPGCTDVSACNFDSTATIDDGTCEFTSCAGCIDSTACNYDSTATLNDGSCDFTSCAGCLDSTACNYDSTATIDDGTCEFTSCACPEDVNGDGMVSVSDVLALLSEFNCLTGCTADVDGDGAVTVSDLLAILAAFGNPC